MNKSGDQSGALLTGVQAPDGITERELAFALNYHGDDARIKDADWKIARRYFEVVHGNRGRHPSLGGPDPFAAAVSPEAPEPNIPKGSGVQPPDGSTERDAARYRWLRVNYSALICATGRGDPIVTFQPTLHNPALFTGDLLDAAVAASGFRGPCEAVCAEPLAATAGASENSDADEPKQGDHLSEQPSVDRCVLTESEPSSFSASNGVNDDHESDGRRARRLAGEGDDDQLGAGRQADPRAGRRARDDSAAEHDAGLLRARARGDSRQGDAERLIKAAHAARIREGQ